MKRLAKASDICSIERVAGGWHVDIWTAEGDPMTVGVYATWAKAQAIQAALVRAVRSWSV